jgi:hypothetical protein
VELDRQFEQIAQREIVVQRDALGNLGQEGIDGQWIVESTHSVDHGAHEGVLADDTTEVAGAVVVPHTILQPLVVTASRHGQGLEARDELATRGLDVEA